MISFETLGDAEAQIDVVGSFPQREELDGYCAHSFLFDADRECSGNQHYLAQFNSLAVVDVSESGQRAIGGVGTHST